ncbi:metal transporter family protein [Gregarina niphandrodes]|uniref:Metal transporter family protein n=1 Tax=Gregarina niphandrodes TaxID=110365 RepID=A0A023B9C9_GRENI|nr:metal transporter family protein [Gregarina niphandrodes]EZG72376.1 metal transporter family protein [Gregarina niphandrodes]|eukprot:XP_011129774.1 metal transporter family protein [Gregarina niphandrodes]
MLSFAAGVMILVSFVEVYNEGLEQLQDGSYLSDATLGKGAALSLFFLGWIITSVLDGALHLATDWRQSTAGGTAVRKPLPTKQLSGKQLDAQSLAAASGAGRKSLETCLHGSSPVWEGEQWEGGQCDGLHQTRTSRNGSAIYPAHTCVRRESALRQTLTYVIQRLGNSPAVAAVTGRKAVSPWEQERVRREFEEEAESMKHVGYFTAAVLALHNIPEGMATGVASHTAVRVQLALAIGIHNIPEGLAVAVPIYYGTKSRSWALLMTFVSGMAEPFGALLVSFISPRNLGPALLLTAGIMVNVAVKELLYNAWRNDPANQVTSVAFFFGMAVMGLSLIALNQVPLDSAPPPLPLPVL